MTDEEKGLTPEVFENIFNAHFKGLTLFSFRYVKDIEAAKEIVQDAFVSLWEKRESIDVSKQVKSYLSTIVYNKSLNYLRDNRKFSQELLKAENLYGFVSYSGSDSELISSEITGKINSALEMLPEKCREVFKMSRFGDMKYQQIADALNISIKTVEAQMAKALKIMREELADYIKAIIIVFLININ